MDVIERNLAKIADKAKYLSEPAWTPEGCAIVGQQIHAWAVEAMDAHTTTRGAVDALEEIARAGEGVPDWRAMADIAREALRALGVDPSPTGGR
jgi:hypothetical protein